MNPRGTWMLVLSAAALFLLILFVERPYRAERNRPPDMRILPGFDVTNIMAVQIRPGDRLDVRAERANGQWKLVAPVSYPADTPKINAFLRALTEARWQAHVTSEELRDRPKAQEEFGFDTPQTSVILYRQDGDHRHLKAGNRTAPGDQFYLQIVGGDGFYVMDGKLLELLPQQTDDWRDPGLVGIPALTEADTLTVRSANKSFQLAVDSTNRVWRMLKPLETRADTPKLFQLIQTFCEAKALQFVADGAELDYEKFGISSAAGQPAALEILFQKGTNILDGLQTGVSPTNQPGAVYARRANQTAVFLVDKTVLEPWRAPLADFRDRRMMQTPTNAVRRIEIRGRDSFELRCGPNDAWSVTGPESFAADASLVRDLMVILQKITVHFEDDVVTDFAPFGLDSPVLGYTVHAGLTNPAGTVESVSETFLFGTNGTEKIFLRRSGDDRLYSVGRQEFELLPDASWQLRDRRVWNFAVSNVTGVVIRQAGMKRELLRRGENDWGIAPGSQGVVNPFSAEEALFRLGGLEAVYWIARGDTPDDVFGFKKTDHSITVMLNRNGKEEQLTLEFGGFSPFYHPYAATMVHGRRMVFEFPLPLFTEFVRRDLSITPTPLPQR